MSRSASCKPDLKLFVFPKDTTVTYRVTNPSLLKVVAAVGCLPA